MKTPMVVFYCVGQITNALGDRNNTDLLVWILTAFYIWQLVDIRIAAVAIYHIQQMS